MTESDYKNLVKILRGMVADAINLKNEFRLSDSDIASILTREAQAEEIITAAYIDDEN